MSSVPNFEIIKFSSLVGEVSQRLLKKLLQTYNPDNRISPVGDKKFKEGKINYRLLGGNCTRHQPVITREAR